MKIMNDTLSGEKKKKGNTEKYIVLLALKSLAAAGINDLRHCEVFLLALCVLLKEQQCSVLLPQ